MAQIFKKIKSILGKEKKKEKPKKKTGAKKPPAKTKPKKTHPKKILTEEIATVLRAPHISEKATELTDQNKYVFKIDPRANKIQAKGAIESIYDVEVEKINIINVPKKRKVFQGIEGSRPGHKKAIVSLKQGDKIEILPH